MPDLNRAVAPLDFSTNDYLCLSQHRALIEAAIRSGRRFGAGATGSRLLSGHLELFQQLEKRVAEDKGSEEALIFVSGFQCNLSALATLLDKKSLRDRPLVFFDRCNHASLYQAVFLSGAELIRYRHNNMGHLEDQLRKFAKSCRPKFIVTETLFGMDGDVIPLRDIVEMAGRYKAFLYLDEAHATGIVGDRGYGLSTTVDLRDLPHAVMGTFSKALGTSGGYIACSAPIKEYLINFCPGFIYSTANSPLVVGAALAAWEILPSLEKEREKLWENGHFLRGVLREMGVEMGSASTHIVPLFFGSEERAIAAQSRLLQAGIATSCVRPPTVPPGTSRLRIALNAKHTRGDIERLIASIRTL